MFNNLVESDLHAKENARRSWFFLGTLVAYALSLMIAGVVSIYAYDARLEEQTNEYSVTFIPPVQPAEAPPQRNTEPTRGVIADVRRIAERPTPIARISDSTKPPDTISSTPSTVRELPPGPVAITGRDIDVGTSGIPGRMPGNGNPVGETQRPVRVEIEEAPPQRVEPTPPPRILKVSTVLNGRALQLPKPPYPQLAKNAGVSGVVTVQVLIDESGKVLSAQAISGHPLLRSAAAQAARQARFSPTILGEQPVKVSGVITYNFTL